MTPEGAIKATFVKECRRLNIPVIPMELARGKGIPDKLVLLPGERVAWVEAKNGDKGVLSPEQEEMISALQNRGHTVYILKSHDGARELANTFYLRIQALNALEG